VGRAGRARLDGGDTPLAHGDVGVAAGAAAAVDQVSTADQQVVHGSAGIVSSSHVEPDDPGLTRLVPV